MKISFLIMDIRAGGAEKVLSVLVNGLSSLGHETSVICLNGDRNAHFFSLSPSVRIIALNRWPSVNHVICGKLIRDWSRISILSSAIKQEQPDVLVSFLSNMNIYGAWAALLCKVPHIACERNSPWHKPDHPQKRRKRDLAFSISRGCVFQTTQVRDYFPNHVKRRSMVIPNPVVLTCLPLDENIARDKVIISVGRYEKQKNQKMLIDSFFLFQKRFPDYRLVMYGMDYGLKSELSHYAKQIGIGDKVVLNDPVKNIHEKVRTASLFALTSNYEGMPNALAEAVALSVPCVATDCRSGGPAFVLNHEKRGLLAPVGDVTRFAEAMVRLIEDHSLWQEMAQSGKGLVSELSMNQYVKKWDTYLHSGVG